MDEVPKGDPNLTFFIILMVVGFLVGTYGHIIKSNKVIATGIFMVFAATILLPLVIFRGGR